MANKPRVICHKEKIPRRNETQFESSTERFLSADEFLKEFSFSIDSEDSKRFTNNFVEFPDNTDSYKSQLQPFSASSLQDLTSKSDTQLESTHPDSSSLKLSKGKQQSLTDVTGDFTVPGKKKPQQKPVSKSRHISDSVKREKRPNTAQSERKTVSASKGKTTPPSDYRSKSRNTTLQKSVLRANNSHAPPLDSLSLHSTPFTHPPKHPHIEVALPHPEEHQPGLPLDLQNALLLTTVNLNLSAQKAFSDSEKEALQQLAKLHAYKQKLMEKNYKLREEAERLDFESVSKSAVDELVSVEEVLTKLNLAGAQMQKLTEAMTRAQSTVRFRNIHMSERDREQCEKYLRELSSAATHSLTNMRSLLGQLPAVLEGVQQSAKDSEEDLEKVRTANERLEEFASVMLSKVSLESHVALLEENLALAKDPKKYISFDINDIDPS